MTTNEQAVYTPSEATVRGSYMAANTRKPYYGGGQQEADRAGEAFDRWLAGERHRVAAAAFKYGALMFYTDIPEIPADREAVIADAMERYLFAHFPAVGGSTPAVEGGGDD